MALEKTKNQEKNIKRIEKVIRTVGEKFGLTMREVRQIFGDGKPIKLRKMYGEPAIYPMEKIKKGR